MINANDGFISSSKIAENIPLISENQNHRVSMLMTKTRLSHFYSQFANYGYNIYMAMLRVLCWSDICYFRSNGAIIANAQIITFFKNQN